MTLFHPASPIHAFPVPASKLQGPFSPRLLRLLQTGQGGLGYPPTQIIANQVHLVRITFLHLLVKLSILISDDACFVFIDSSRAKRLSGGHRLLLLFLFRIEVLLYLFFLLPFGSNRQGFDQLDLLLLKKSSKLPVVPLDGLKIEDEVVDAEEINDRTHREDHFLHSFVFLLNFELSLLYLSKQPLSQPRPVKEVETQHHDSHQTCSNHQALFPPHLHQTAPLLRHLHPRNHGVEEEGEVVETIVDTHKFQAQKQGFGNGRTVYLRCHERQDPEDILIRIVPRVPVNLFEQENVLRDLLFQDRVVVGLHRKAGLLDVHLAKTVALLPPNRYETPESPFHCNTEIDSSGSCPKFPMERRLRSRDMQTGLVRLYRGHRFLQIILANLSFCLFLPVPFHLLFHFQIQVILFFVSLVRNRVVLPQKLIILANTSRSSMLLIHLICPQRFVGEKVGQGIKFPFGEMFEIVEGVVVEMLVLMSENLVGGDRLIMVSEVVEQLLGSELLYLGTLQLAMSFALIQAKDLLHQTSNSSWPK